MRLQQPPLATELAPPIAVEHAAQVGVGIPGRHQCRALVMTVLVPAEAMRRRTRVQEPTHGPVHRQARAEKERRSTRAATPSKDRRHGLRRGGAVDQGGVQVAVRMPQQLHHHAFTERHAPGRLQGHDADQPLAGMDQQHPPA